MKRILFLLLIVTSTVFSANGTGIIVKSGLLLGNTNDSMAVDSAWDNHVLAPNLIVGFEFSLSRTISFDIGAGAVLHGMNYVRTTNSVAILPGKTRLLYLTVPIRVKFMAPTSLGGIYVAMGPKFDFLMAVDEEIDGSVTGTGVGKDSYKNVNIALGLHIGGEIALGNHHLTLESGYDFGLTDVMDFGTYKTTTGQITLLSVGFRFNTDMID